MAKKNGRNRSLYRIIWVTLAALALIVTNVFFVSVLKIHWNSKTDLSVYADTANTVSETTQALRGNIYDRNGSIIAQDNRTYNILCILSSDRPSISGEVAYVKDKEHTAEVLSSILKMDYNKCLDYLNQDVYQTEMGSDGRNLNKSVKDEIENEKLPGIEFTPSVTRVYPNGQFASNLIGYAQADDNGQESGRMGLEQILDNYLQGTDGSRTYQVDKDGYVLPGMKETVVSAVNGDDVYLTLDAGIQQALETSFSITQNTFDTQQAWGSVMEISTGRILAWGQTPSFDPNVREITEFNNIGAQLPYEPGSTLKSIVWAAAMNEGKYTGSNTAEGYKYCYVSDSNNDPVRTSDEENAYGCIMNANSKNYGSVDLDHGLIYSLNTVAATIQNEYITPETHLEYLKKFGFFQSVDTDGLQESPGYLQFTWPGDKISLSYGQGSTVNMLQMLQAYSAIFGNGTMVKPYFVDSIRSGYDHSKVIYQAETQTTGSPITEETAKEMQALLYRVVNDPDGGARFYQIPECKIMGKTGTAQVAGEDGKYLEDVYTTSFMCALPAENPQVIVYYCFKTKVDPQAYAKTDAVKNLLRKVALSYGTGSSAEAAANAEANQDHSSTGVETEMPELSNHTLEYAQQKLADLGMDVVVLGTGSTVVNQYPQTGTTIKSGQRIFLLTDPDRFIMPDLTGWTRKDVTALWAVSGFGFRLSGEGKAVSQSIAAGTTVTKGETIEVVFQ